MDIEKPVRESLRRILGGYFCCFEEVPLITLKNKCVRADVLAISKYDSQIPVVFAFEVKSHLNNDPGKYKKTIMQTANYVGASINPKHAAFKQCSGIVDAGVVFPAPAFHWHGRLEESDGRAHLLTGMSFLAEFLNVGQFCKRGDDWEIKFGSNEVWTKKKGWMGNAVTRFVRRGIITNMMKERFE